MCVDLWRKSVFNAEVNLDIVRPEFRVYHALNALHKLLGTQCLVLNARTSFMDIENVLKVEHTVDYLLCNTDGLIKNLNGICSNIGSSDVMQFRD